MSYSECFELICLPASALCLLCSIPKDARRSGYSLVSEALLTIPFIAFTVLLGILACIGGLVGLGFALFADWNQRRARRIASRAAPSRFTDDRRSIEQLRAACKIEQARADLLLEREYDRRVRARRIQRAHLRLIAGTDFMTKRQAG